jgi:hypothetical protein
MPNAAAAMMPIASLGARAARPATAGGWLPAAPGARAGGADGLGAPLFVFMEPA